MKIDLYNYRLSCWKQNTNRFFSGCQTMQTTFWICDV